MGKRGNLVVAAPALCLLVPIIFDFGRSSELSYNGHSLRYWVHDTGTKRLSADQLQAPSRDGQQRNPHSTEPGPAGRGHTIIENGPFVGR